MKGSYHAIDHHIIKTQCLGLIGFTPSLLVPSLNLRPLDAAPVDHVPHFPQMRSCLSANEVIQVCVCTS